MPPSSAGAPSPSFHRPPLCRKVSLSGTGEEKGSPWLCGAPFLTPAPSASALPLVPFI